MFTSNTEIASPVATSRRPVPLVARPDLISRPMGPKGNSHWVVKVPMSLQYYRLRLEEYFLLQLLDGRRTLEELHGCVRREYPASPLQLADIQRLAIDLFEKGLADSNRPGQGASRVAAHR